MLRAFRDRRLSPHPMGRVVLRLYDCLGPAAATILNCSPMRPMAKQVIQLLLRLLPDLRIPEANDSTSVADPKPVPDRDATPGKPAHTTARGSHVERGV